MKSLLLLVSICIAATAHAQLTELKPGMKITASVKVRKALFTLKAQQDLSTPVIEISGNNIVVDFNNAILNGSNDQQLPDQFQGLAVLVKGGKNVTIKNLRAQGYKVALMARDVEGLVIENCDLSYNYRQRLNSTQEKEDISDWMSYHHNEKDEWLRYGAAIYLRNCNKARIYGNLVTGGQCALMMTQCNDGWVYSNNFSFNSAIGIGMYRSSGNRIMHNQLDWNVRGHSEGVYNRGQDSAAILVFEQCNENFFVDNSATHSGDGFFLWAGQTTMDTGEGGCNDNVILSNNFSYAPTNGIEVTFSRNKISENVVIGCDHGIWGGYSYDSDIRLNIFQRNRIAIAIEHGQENYFIANSFMDNKESIRLWARKEQPKDWGYAQKRDTRSRNYSISSNRFQREGIVYNISNTAPVTLYANRKYSCGTVYKLDSLTLAGIDSSDEQQGTNNILHYSQLMELPVVEERKTPQLAPNYPQGRNQIRITEWGPYDFRSPILWRINPLDTSGLLKFELVGPRGKWKIRSSKGVDDISKAEGVFPDTLTARKINGHKGGIYIELIYMDDGSQQTITNPFGKVAPKGKPYFFGFRDTRVPMQWQMNWFDFDSVSNPVNNPVMLKELQSATPFMSQRVRDLNFAWWGGISPGP
ncbi:MAG TPA: right-handed parallel beta-helix repeat-containing protein, partial [Chitinophagaceae bacterium]|nr:right-handed parallel beta-helix repeat-containing protein [Chitinophagaceae bacterium]